VEDNKDGRESLRWLLQAFGHKVEVAADGPEGLRKALALRPEAVVIDIGLPGIDGYEVCRRLRSTLGRSTFLIAHTAYCQPEDRQRAREVGFDAFVPKPCNVGEIQSLLSGRQSHFPDAPTR
jgi:CheY-like chemotaxis protein